MLRVDMENVVKIKSDFTNYKLAFLEENSKHNLISKNDERYLYEKHIYDSLSIKLFFEKYDIKRARILDIGCGGGFPCVPLAIEFSEMKIVGIDSIRKKINSVQSISEKLNLKNLELICDRAENLKGEKFDGSQFWKQALDNGAEAVIIENAEITPEDIQQYSNKTKF